MRRDLSIYLDLLRIAAAAVFMSHLARQQLTEGWLWRIQPLGHSAVIVFFVLSGFVIQHVASTRDTHGRTFAVNRLARLYSVVLPAIVLTVICDAIGMLQNPSLYMAANQTDTLLRSVASALFISQSWSWKLELFSNSAFWSLPYEFWYYVLFGTVFYLRGQRRIWATCLAALMAGPNILLLLPIWMFGVLAWRASTSLTSVSDTFARQLFYLSLLLIALCFALDILYLVERSTSPDLPLSFSILDYVLGAAVAVNIFAVSRSGVALQRFETPIRKAAGFTFSLYLYHVPLLLMVAAFLPPDWPVLVRMAVLVATVVPTVVLLGTFTEGRRVALRKVLDRLVPPVTRDKVLPPQN